MTFLDQLKDIAGDSLTHYYELDDTSKAKDLVGSIDGKVHGSVRFAADGAHFDGKSWIELPDHRDFSAGPTKEFTACAFLEVNDWKTSRTTASTSTTWARARRASTSGPAAYYMDGGGGEATCARRRTSFYAFNPGGGLGAGSYVQDATASNHERMMTGVIYAKGSGSHPGVSRQYQNGVKKDEDKLAGYNITPERTSAVVGLGSRGDNTGFLVGRLRRVAFFKSALTDAQIKRIYDARNEANAGGGASHPQSPPASGTTSGSGGLVANIGGATRAIDAVNVERKADQLVAYNAAGWDWRRDRHQRVRHRGRGPQRSCDPGSPGRGQHCDPGRRRGALRARHGARVAERARDEGRAGRAPREHRPGASPEHPPEAPDHDPTPTRVVKAHPRVEEAGALRKEAAELRKAADALDVIATQLGG